MLTCVRCYYRFSKSCAATPLVAYISALKMRKHFNGSHISMCCHCPWMVTLYLLFSLNEHIFSCYCRHVNASQREARDRAMQMDAVLRNGQITTILASAPSFKSHYQQMVSFIHLEKLATECNEPIDWFSIFLYSSKRRMQSSGCSVVPTKAGSIDVIYTHKFTAIE